MYTHHCRGWTLTPLCSYIPSPINASPCISPLSPICNLPHPAIAVAHIHSPLLSLRFLTQERHYSPNLIIMISPPVFYPLPFPLDPYVCDMAIREQIGTAFLFFVTLLPLFRNRCISIRDCFLLSFLLSVKAAHKHRVFWICSLVGCIWTCRVGNCQTFECSTRSVR